MRPAACGLVSAAVLGSGFSLSPGGPHDLGFSCSLMANSSNLSGFQLFTTVRFLTQAIRQWSSILVEHKNAVKQFLKTKIPTPALVSD